MKQTMNPEIRDRWTAALRSGDYQQGKNKMRRRINGEYFFCCLGVLCDQYSQDPKTDQKIGWEHTEGYLNTGTYSMLGWTGILPAQVREWAGFPTDLVEKAQIGVTYKNKRTTLGALNDRGVSFNEIADIIEENF